MIIEFLINIFFGVINVILRLLDVLPDMPQSIIDATTTLISYIEVGSTAIKVLLGTPLFMAIVAITGSIISFYAIWKPVVFFYRRIKS